MDTILSGYFSTRIKTMTGVKRRIQNMITGMCRPIVARSPIMQATSIKEIKAIKIPLRIVLNNFILILTFLFNYGMLILVLSRGECYETN